MTEYKPYQYLNHMQQHSPDLPNQKAPYDVLEQENEVQNQGRQALNVQNSAFLHEKRYKSFNQLLFIVLNIGLSSFYFGYALAYLSAVDFNTLIRIYNIEMKKEIAQGLLVGCIPIGGGIGALSATYLIKHYSRRHSILIVNLVAFLTGLMLFYPSMITLLGSRLIQGICSGLYSSLVPVIMKQISPTQIAGTLTSFHQISISFGVFFAFGFSQLVELLFQDPTNQHTWYIIFGFTLPILLIQTFILHFIYNFETPKYLYLHNQDHKGQQLIEKLYKQQYVLSVINQIKSNIGRVSNQYQVQSLSEQQNQNRQSTTPRVAGIVAIHLAAMQQFSGINAILAYGGESVAQLAPSMRLALPILINFEQFIAAVFSSFLLSKIGRKTLFQYGCLASFLSCFITAFGFYYKESNSQLALGLIVTGLIIFMANFGLTLGPVVWVYIPEVVQPQFLPYATGTNWGTAAFIMLFFPVVKQSLPGQNPALLFLFFAFCCVAAFFINQKLLIETKDKTQKQISEQFRQKRELC